jgi:tetratricopeptide (TPR) repeat protein
MWILLARSVSLSGLGRWSEAEPPLDEAAELAERLGDGRSWCEIVASKGTTTGARGAYLDSIAIYESVLKNAERRGDFQSQGWGVLGQARGYAALRRLDRLDEILARAAELASAAGGDIDLLTQYDHRALRALRELHRGDDERARAELVDMAHALRTQRAPNQWMLMHPFSAFAEAAVELWSRHPERRDDRALARTAWRRLRRFARIFPCAKPRASWLAGRIADLRGRRAQAIEHWRSGLSASRALEMRYDEWLCCGALAGAAQSDVPDRDALKRRARELALQIGFE